MAAVDVLQKVKEAEKEHEARVDKARGEAERMIVDTNRQAKEIIEKARDEANKKAAVYIKDAEEKASREAEERKQVGKEEIVRIKEMAGNNMDSAISFIVERIVR